MRPSPAPPRERGRHAAPPATGSHRATRALDALLSALLRLPGRRGYTSRASRAAAAAVCLGLLAVGGSAGAAALGPGPVAPAPGRTVLVAAAAAVPAPSAAPLSAGVPSGVAVADPTAVRVPSLGVSSSLVRLGTTADGALEVPSDAAQAGWFAQGAAPGAVGPAVIAGHVDSRTGPGVFADLARVAVGAQVEVARSDGSTAVFVVTGVQQVAKDAFPTQEVYGPVAGPELRLITCGGAFDESTRHYVDNVVVYARLAQTTTP